MNFALEVVEAADPGRRALVELARDGSRREIEWTNRALLDASGDVFCFVTTGLDVTERERATDAIVLLAQEQAALRRVATLVASSPAPRRW